MIRPAREADTEALAPLLAQLGYPFGSAELAANAYSSPATQPLVEPDQREPARALREEGACKRPRHGSRDAEPQVAEDVVANLVRRDEEHLLVRQVIRDLDWADVGAAGGAGDAVGNGL